MNLSHSDISIILDRSGSMNSNWIGTIEAVNSFIADQAAAPGTCNFSLHVFDNLFETVFDNIPLTKAIKVPKTIQPRSSTALLDSVGRVIESTGARLAAMPEADRPGTVIITVQTDGYENASTDFTVEKLAQMIKHQTEVYNWQFVFLGAGIDTAQAQALSFMPTAQSSYENTSLGASRAFSSFSGETIRYRNAVANGVAASLNIADASDRSRK